MDARRGPSLVRIDPAVVTFRVHYSPDDPHTINGWRDVLPQAAVILNGSFFDEMTEALGLLVSDGQFFGQSFVGFGGMFQVTASGRARAIAGQRTVPGRIVVPGGAGVPHADRSGRRAGLSG